MSTLFDTFDVLRNYEEKKLVKLNKHPTEDLYLRCYTKSCFHGPRSNWDSITKNSRGHVINQYGREVNMPFSKIFNVDEVPETAIDVVRERMENESYEVVEKSNGHLCILFKWLGKWYNTTKGSWDHEFVQQDRELLEEMGIIDRLDKYPGAHTQTFMFEVIADYDPHTLHEQNMKKYSGNTMVLLDISSADYPDDIYLHSDLANIAQSIGCDVVEKYDFGGYDIKYWYDHTDIEGYVIRFVKDNTRVKVKTHEYLKMRYANEMEGGNKIKKLFTQHFMDEAAIKNEIPEEYYWMIDKLYAHFKIYMWGIESKYIEMLNDIKEENDLTGTELRIHIDQTYDGIDSTMLFCMLNKGHITPSYAKSHFIEEYSFEFEKEKE